MDANPPFNWKGFMKSLNKTNVKARSQIEFLQIIDQPPENGLYNTYRVLEDSLSQTDGNHLRFTALDEG